MLADLMPALTYGFAAAVTPGPLSMYLISQALAGGWRRALPIAFSPLISDGPVAVLVLSVLSQAPSDVVQLLRIPGGFFILYLAFDAWKTWRTPEADEAGRIRSGPHNLWKAAVVNWLNPNLYLGWSIIMGPIVLSGGRQSPAKGIALVAAFYAMLIGTMIGMVILSAATRNFGPKARKNLILISSIALAGLGLYQLWMGVSALRS
jgi:threonine/homoserine/homoserine lactone efflux protein